MVVVAVTIFLIVAFTIILAIADQHPAGCLIMVVLAGLLLGLGIECWVAAVPSIGDWNYGAQGFAALTAIVFAIGGMLALSEVASDIARWLYHKN